MDYLNMLDVGQPWVTGGNSSNGISAIDWSLRESLLRSFNNYRDGKSVGHIQTTNGDIKIYLDDIHWLWRHLGLIK